MTTKMHVNTYMKFLIFNFRVHSLLKSICEHAVVCGPQRENDLEAREKQLAKTLVERIQQLPTPVMAKNSNKMKAMKRENRKGRRDQ